MKKSNLLRLLHTTTLVLAIFSKPLKSQNPSFQDTIFWENPIEEKISNYDKKTFLYFKNAQYDDKSEFLPLYVKTETLPFFGNLSGYLTDEKFAPLNATEKSAFPNQADLQTEFRVDFYSGISRNQPYAEIRIFPFRKRNNTIEKLLSFTVNFAITPEKYITNKSLSKTSGEREVNSSVLGSGRWYRFGIVNSGIYKLSKSFLSSLGMNPDQIDPRKIRIFGNGGVQLPERNVDYYPDDLMENPIFISGESDGKMDPGDFILFYGRGTTSWRYDASKGIFRHSKNLYSDTTWYFINADQETGKRIQNQQSLDGPANVQVTDFDDFRAIENEEENVLKSGRRWLGNKMEILSNYSFAFNFPDITSGPHKVIANLAGKNVNPLPAGGFPETQMNISVNGQNFQQVIPKLNGAGYLDTYCREIEAVHTFSGNSPNINLTITKLNSSSTAWIDYLILNVRRNLRFTGPQMSFRNQSATGSGNISQFILSNADSNIRIWDISDYYDVKNQLFNNLETTVNFIISTENLKEFIAFNPNGNFPSPAPGGMVNNQNLHASEPTELLIVCHPKFNMAGKRIAEHHRQFDKMKVTMVSPQEIYNEFSSGKQDIGAIRNYAKWLYNLSPNEDEKLKYLLLIGDASYDPKFRIKNNSNYIPVYQSPESFSPIGSYASDDFFGLLDPDEGGNIGSIGGGKLDIGIGRLPVSTVEEADAVAEKIIYYTTSRNTLNDWRNILCFVSDDEDKNDHLEQAEAVSEIIRKSHFEYNIEKIYLDAYQQVSGSGGQRYPQVNTDITNRIERGSLLMNYAGHGGEQSLALERVITIPEINGWSNKNNLTFFITATCEFSRFDNPDFTSAGEYVILNPNGAGVGLLTTTRLTFSSSNKALNLNVMDTILGVRNNRHLTLGETMMISKNQTGSSVNSRSFALLGDPAMTLAFPKFKVVTTEINGKPVSAIPDTINALQLVNIKGYITSSGTSPLNSYNGIIYPTIYDKFTTATTLSNDGPESPARQYKIQRNIIFKGPVSVINGEFSFSFVVPQDIKFNFDSGKISYYSKHNDNQDDANGYFNNFVIGGFSKNPVKDDQGPKIRLYMNNEQFVSGGITNENPVMIAFAEDDIGINTAGTGIGHDITAILDGNSANPIVLNDFYEAEKDNYRKGKITYPFKNLSPGNHTLTLKVWDVANNSAEANIEFTVVKSEAVSLAHVLNYPNPFSNQTRFLFEHNQPGVPLDVDIRIFTVSGKLVKTIQTVIQTNGFRSETIPWDGRDDYGDKIGRGVYVYRLRIQTPDGKSAEKFEKLVILN